MEWSEELRSFRREVDSLRLERAHRVQVEDEQRGERLVVIREAFEALQPESYLSEINRHLLDDHGQVTLYLPWDPSSEKPPEDETASGDDEEDPEDEDVASAILNWEEGGGRELAVDVGLEGDEVYLQVNGEDVRIEEGAMKEALKRAFTEELDLQ